MPVIRSFNPSAKFRPDPVGKCDNCGRKDKVKPFGKAKLCARCAESLKVRK